MWTNAYTLPLHNDIILVIITQYYLMSLGNKVHFILLLENSTTVTKIWLLNCSVCGWGGQSCYYIQYIWHKLSFSLATFRTSVLPFRTTHWCQQHSVCQWIRLGGEEEGPVPNSAGGVPRVLPALFCSSECACCVGWPRAVEMSTKKESC